MISLSTAITRIPSIRPRTPGSSGGEGVKTSAGDLMRAPTISQDADELLSGAEPEIRELRGS